MKASTWLLLVFMAFFLAVVILLMFALIGGFLSVWGYLATNLVWFGLFIFFAWVVNTAYENDKAEKEEANADEETT